MPFAKDKLRAFASVTLDDCLVIHGLKIIEGSGRLFVAMPNRRRPDYSFQDIVHPITTEMREELERAVLEAYRWAGSKDEGEANAPVDH